jgi:hypothetical protein
MVLSRWSTIALLVVLVVAVTALAVMLGEPQAAFAGRRGP